jgi:hypothetical protein
MHSHTVTKKTTEKRSAKDIKFYVDIVIFAFAIDIVAGACDQNTIHMLSLTCCNVYDVTTLLRSRLLVVRFFLFTYLL